LTNDLKEEMKRLGKDVEETVYFESGPDFYAISKVLIRALNIWKSATGLRAIKRGKYNKLCQKNHNYERWGDEDTGLLRVDCIADLKIIVQSGGENAFIVYYNSKCLIEQLKEYNEKIYSVILGENR